MYKTICVPVDNSDHSNQAIQAAARIGQLYGSKVVGSHVYAAQLHDYRFKQMEYTLPEEYLDEGELEKQRKIHDSLITMGLKLISDSYLDPVQAVCDAAGLELERKMIDGKHHVELSKDIEESGYDLVVMGGLGLGKVRDSQIGSVVERVTRSCNRDFLVIKRLPEKDGSERDTILVALDGSPQSFGGLATAVELAERFDKKIELISVYDPYLHYAVFSSVVDVLSEKAAKVFRFEEQNQLHEEIIDTGLAQIYQSHLEMGETLLERRGISCTKTLLDGKAFQKILDHIKVCDPWLLVLGRIGVHSDLEEPGLGSNTDNLLRSAPCDILLSARRETPELDLQAEETIRWTTEAEERMSRVPPLVKGIARTGILRLAVEQGHSVITNSLIDEAMDRFMPKQTARMSEELAEAIALDHAASQPTAICKSCGITATEANPKKCSVCGATDFELITREMIERIASMEGGVEEETTYDGRKIKWTQTARQAVRAIGDKYQRRRCKARIEKGARVKKLDTITLDFAFKVIEDETGSSLDDLAEGSAVETPEVDDQGRRVVATDVRGNEMWSKLSWSEDALHRILRVPAGFMRQKTQDRVEELAGERGTETVEVELVEDGIQMGRQLMADMVKGYGEKLAAAPSREQLERAAAAGECPVELEPVLDKSPKRYEQGHYVTGDPRLNEVGEMADKAASKLRIPYDRALEEESPS